MSGAATLAERYEAGHAEAADGMPGHVRMLLRRAYMAGALACLEAQRSGATREQLLAECVQFGRAIGTTAEQAA